MIAVGILSVEPFYEEQVRTEYMKKLGRYRLEKAVGIKKEKEQARSVGVGLLLEKMLSEACHVSLDEVKGFQYECGEHGKPYLLDYPEMNFNLSHSGDYVVCAVSDKKVGIDIQLYGKYKENVAKRFFSTEECDELNRTTDEEEKRILFYQIWAGKESYTKWLDTGLTIPLSDFTIDCQKKKVTGGRTCNLTFIDVHPDYACAVVCDEKDDLILKQFSFDVF